MRWTTTATLAAALLAGCERPQPYSGVVTQEQLSEGYAFSAEGERYLLSELYPRRDDAQWVLLEWDSERVRGLATAARDEPICFSRDGQTYEVRFADRGEDYALSLRRADCESQLSE